MRWRSMFSSSILCLLIVDWIMPTKLTSLKFGADSPRPNWTAWGSRILSVHDDSLWHMILSSHLFFKTRTSKLKTRQILPKSSKFRVTLASMTTSFASFKWLANLFGSRESTRSWRTRMRRPTNVADILEVGEKCFEDELYQAAKLLFTSISNWARLATTLIYLGENHAAVRGSRKAGNTQQVNWCPPYQGWC